MAGDIGPGEGGLGEGTHDVAGDPGVPVTGATQHLYGQGDSAPLVGNGTMRPWMNGAPRGEQDRIEAQEMADQYKFMPEWAGRLRAATRRAFGR